MWALDNRTPFAAARSWTRDRTGLHRWLVAVKATYTISPDGRLTLAEQQLPPLLAPEHFADPSASSIRYEADVGPDKPSTDILLNASAHAPHGRPVASVTVTLRVGTLTKTLRVHGERVYEAGGASPAVPFLTRPIRYELAWGGSDTRSIDREHQTIDLRNPIGRGHAGTRMAGKHAHCIEYLDGHPARRGPAGFGAIAGWWTPRRQYAGTYDDAWARTKRPLLPDDHDDRFDLCAPADQNAGLLGGGERIELEHMTPAGSLRLTVPRVHLEFRTTLGTRRIDHHGRVASVLVEPDDMRLVLTWRTSLPVASPDAAYLDQTTISAVAGVP